MKYRQLNADPCRLEPRQSPLTSRHLRRQQIVSGKAPVAPGRTDRGDAGRSQGCARGYAGLAARFAFPYCQSQQCGIHSAPRNRGFRARYPGISVRFVTTDSHQAKATRDQADMVFVEDDAVFSGSGDWLQQVLVETDIGLLVPEGHPWAASARLISLTDLSSETLI